MKNGKLFLYRKPHLMTIGTMDGVGMGCASGNDVHLVACSMGAIE